MDARNESEFVTIWHLLFGGQTESFDLGKVHFSLFFFVSQQLYYYLINQLFCEALKPNKF